MKCALCSSRKGKRRCPAVAAEICASCCGEKRLIEIACPADCPYLAEGQRNDTVREWEDYMRHQEPAKAQRWIGVMEDLLPLMDMIEQAIVTVAVAMRDLEDRELAEALASLRQGYSSEDSGILYHPASPSPRVQMLLRESRERIEALREGVRQEGSNVPPRAIVECIEVLSDRLEFHRTRPGASSFVVHLRRLRPPGPAEERLSSETPLSGIIIP